MNSAGASLTPDPVHRAMTEQLQLERALGPYEAEALARPELSAMYDNLAQLLNAQPDEIAWADSATRAWDMAFYALPLQPGDNIVTHSSEYGSNYLAFLQRCRQRGVELRFAPSRPGGVFDPDTLASVIDGRTRLISATHVPTQGGFVNPVEAIGDIAKEHGVPFLVDACNSVGQMQIDVKAIGCTFLSAAGRKFLRGPRGSGFLYISKVMLPKLEPPFIDLNAASWTGARSYTWARASQRFEARESAVVGRLGLNAAVRYALDTGVASIEAYVVQLAKRLRSGLGVFKGVTVHGVGEQRDAIVSFAVQNKEAEAVVRQLRDLGIVLAVSTKADALLDFEVRQLPPLVRVSLHAFNTVQEVDHVLDAISGLVPRQFSATPQAVCA